MHATAAHQLEAVQEATIRINCSQRKQETAEDEHRHRGKTSRERESVERESKSLSPSQSGGQQSNHGILSEGRF